MMPDSEDSGGFVQEDLSDLPFVDLAKKLSSILQEVYANLPPKNHKLRPILTKNKDVLMQIPSLLKDHHIRLYENALKTETELIHEKERTRQLTSARVEDTGTLTDDHHDKPRKTYAAITKEPVPAVILQPKKTEPLPPPRSRTTTSELTKLSNALNTALPAGAADLNVTDIRPIGGKRVLLRFKNADSAANGKSILESHSEALGYDVVSTKPKTSRVIVRRVPKTLSNDDFLKELRVKVNIPPNSVLKIVTRLTSQREEVSTCAIVFEVSQDVRNILTDQRFLMIQWSRCPIEDHVYVPQCTRCCAYGHTSTKCEKSPRCAFCAKSHHTNDCTENADFRFICANCSDSGVYSPTNYHTAYDHFYCSVFKNSRYFYNRNFPKNR
ncbi:uncharacterized protein LOC129587986 [Paramacrobiotus metropolitanus]|uniref:uncharacterized protein LOC129587986 n=1 Tax=Paramacrobiotus metropolitanus TaxID=2943436 RepID=UPI002445D461|nr:uncharacterized protein LOC129587986 [Paramacrobiotus metropolitanus]